MVRQPSRVGRDGVIEVRWAPLARRDLESIDRYHRQDQIDVADDLTGRILDAVRFLMETPLAGPLSYKGNRKWRVAGTPYLIFYRPASNHLRILRIRHGARNTLRL